MRRVLVGVDLGDEGGMSHSITRFGIVLYHELGRVGDCRLPVLGYVGDRLENCHCSRICREYKQARLKKGESRSVSAWIHVVVGPYLPLA
jgi:hypothetical protein